MEHSGVSTSEWWPGICRHLVARVAGCDEKTELPKNRALRLTFHSENGLSGDEGRVVADLAGDTAGQQSGLDL